MKYILPIALSLLFAACNDSTTSSKESLSSNSTVIEQAITNVKQEEPKIEQIVPTVVETKVPAVKQAVTKIVTEKPKVQQSQTEPIAKVEINGETIFSKCKSCHGNSAEKHALGTSQIIKGWEIAKIEKTLKGYKDGTYGREMKNIMSAQAKILSDEEIKKVAIYIHSL